MHAQSVSLIGLLSIPSSNADSERTCYALMGVIFDGVVWAGFAMIWV